MAGRSERFTEPATWRVGRRWGVDICTRLGGRRLISRVCADALSMARSSPRCRGGRKWSTEAVERSQSRGPKSAPQMHLQLFENRRARCGHVCRMGVAHVLLRVRRTDSVRELPGRVPTLKLQQRRIKIKSLYCRLDLGD